MPEEGRLKVQKDMGRRREITPAVAQREGRHEYYKLRQEKTGMGIKSSLYYWAASDEI